MANINLIDRLHDAIENFYRYNPDTLMPLLMVALAAQGKLKISTNHSEGAQSICEMDLNIIKEYDWVRHDPPLCKRIKEILDNGDKILCAEGFLVNDLKGIYETFYHYDNYTVDEEFHHKVGILYHHSNNRESNQAHRQYATLCLAEALVESPIKWLQNAFLKVSHHILVKSGLQPKRPRLRVAEALCSLLQYDGKGKVYNPFAGCGVAAAMIQAGENLYADGNDNNKLFAVANLLTYGMGGSTKHLQQHDSKKWTEDGKFDYIMSTYRGYINGKSAFDFCLEKSFDTLSEQGKFAGIVSPKDIFDKQNNAMSEALKRDWVETIVLLPFGEVAVLINANKSAEFKKVVKFINCTNPLTRQLSISDIIRNAEYSTRLKLSDVKKKGFFRKLLVPELPEREGHKKVYLRDLVTRLPRRVYSLANQREENRVYAYINRNKTYYGTGIEENIERRIVNRLFAPAYHLTKECLIVNSAGKPEPRYFDGVYDNVFFDDGFAFALKDDIDASWLVSQLNETYVRRQLYPYGLSQMVPEPLTENNYLNLQLYKELEPGDEGYVDPEEAERREQEEREKEWKKARREDAIKNALPTDTVLKNGNLTYKIINFISNGCFGYTYRAQMNNNVTGESKIVAIKEYFPREFFDGDCYHDGTKVIYPEEIEDRYERSKQLFESEPDFIMKMNYVKDSHVTEILSVFEIEENDTMYYSMKYYEGETLKDMVESGQVPQSEGLIVDKIVKPLCKALHTMHTHKILHLDIKPENIVIDENGEAVLIDFGVAQEYDNEGVLISKRETPSCSPYSAPENKKGCMQHFNAPADIFGAAGTLYNLFSGKNPKSIDSRRGDWNIYSTMNCSEHMKDAIMIGLYQFASDRPQTAQEFLRLFPGCENIKL